jgi:hypothetical protein
LWDKVKDKAKINFLQFKKLYEYVVNACNKHNVDPKLIDFLSFDFSLSYKEIKAEVKEKLKELIPDFSTEEKTKREIEEEERYYRELALKQEIEHYREEFEKAIETIKNQKTQEIDNYFKTVKELIKITVKGENNALCLISEGGLGKTYTIFKTLTELELKPNRDFVYISSYVTPLELYHILYNNLDKIIILDDVEQLLDNLTTIGILKSATWNAVGKRIVNYFTTSEKLKAPSEFEFKGKIIICLNKIPEKNKEIIDSLLSRIITYNIRFDYQTKIKIFYELAKALNIDFELVDFIKENSNEATENLNFRTLIQLNYIYSYYKKNGGDWKSIIKEFLNEKKDNILEIVLDLIKSGKPTKEQIKIFKEICGLSERTFYRYKAKLSKLSNCQTVNMFRNDS